MKTLTTLITLAALLAMVACGPSAEEKEKAQKESLEEAEAMMKELEAISDSYEGDDLYEEEEEEPDDSDGEMSDEEFEKELSKFSGEGEADPKWDKWLDDYESYFLGMLALVPKVKAEDKDATVEFGLLSAKATNTGMELAKVNLKMSLKQKNRYAEIQSRIIGIASKLR